MKGKVPTPKGLNASCIDPTQADEKICVLVADRIAFRESPEHESEHQIVTEYPWRGAAKLIIHGPHYPLAQQPRWVVDSPLGTVALRLVLHQHVITSNSRPTPIVRAADGGKPYARKSRASAAT